MAILLNDLLGQLSQSICYANQIMEKTSLQQYMDQGYAKRENNYQPVTFSLSLNRESEQYDIPVTALMHNSSMKLEQVEVKLKFLLEEQNGQIMVECRGDKASEGKLSEMTLSFHNTPASEGAGKITDHHLKTI